MEDVLTNVRLYGYKDGSIGEVSEKITDEQFVLHQTNTESMKEHDWAASMNRIPGFGYTNTIPAQKIQWLNMKCQRTRGSLQSLVGTKLYRVHPF